jgi:phosphoglycerate dehydrogenase-like enzyme
MNKRALALALAAPALLAAQATLKVVTTGLPAATVRELQAISPKLQIVNYAPPRTSAPRVTTDRPAGAPLELLKEVADADAFVGAPSRDVIQAGKKLKWVQIGQAGVEMFLYPEIVDSKIVMTNYRATAAPGIADHAFGMLLAFTRKLNLFIANRPQEIWERRTYRLLELNGKTAVVVGMGGIGSQVSKRAAGFGMRVIGVDPKDLPPTPFAESIVYPDRLDEVLPLADVVFVCAPETPQSRGMIGARQFSLMKEGVFFIAVSRGALYDTKALIQALESKRVAAAGLDVTELEPLPKGHPLWKFDNVIITPHIATQCDGESARQMEVLKDNLRRFANGERLRNVVDKQAGY